MTATKLFLNGDFSLAPGFSRVQAVAKMENRFNGFLHGAMKAGEPENRNRIHRR